MLDGQHGLDRFDLHHHEVFRQKVDAIAELELYSQVDDGQTHLRGRMDSRPAKFVLQSSRISAFEQART